MIHGGGIYDKRIELDFSVNLNPYPCPEEVICAIREAVSHISEYPDINQTVFREKVANAENKLAMAESKLSGAENTRAAIDYLTSENVIGGNGASELIMAIIRLINPKKVLLPVPCFYGYFYGIRACGDVEIEQFQLSEEKDFVLDEEFLDCIDESIDLIILGNPNNPTGRLIQNDLLEKIIRRCQETSTALLIDECFLHLSSGTISAAKYLDLCDNLFIVNAYTKLFSIPGVRVGYAISSPANIMALKALLPEWNMSVFAMAAGEACADIVATTDFVERSRAFIASQRITMENNLASAGLKVFSSDTNFILVKSSKRLYDFFLEKGILIRDCGNFEGLGAGYYRFAVRDEKSYERMKQCFCFLT